MAERTQPYSIQAQDGTVVYGIPPTVEPTDPVVQRAVTRAREQGEKEISYPYIQETELAKGMVTGAKRVGLNLAEMFGLVEPERVQAFEAEQAAQPRSMGRSVGQFGTELMGTAMPAAGAVGAAARGARAVPPLAVAMRQIPPALGLAGRGAAEGALEAGILAGPGERVAGATTGALVGGGTGGALGVLAHGFRTPDEAADTLLNMGVDLTPGQMKPGGALNQLEQSMESLPFIGPALGANRRRAQEEFAAALVNQAAPPGSVSIGRSDIHNMTQQLYRRFEPAYEVAKGYPVYKGWDDSLSNIFGRITRNPNVMADDAERRMTDNFLQAQLTRLKKTQLVDSGDLLKVRSKVRAKSRDEKLGTRQRLEVAEMLDAADRAITEELRKQLPAEVMPYLARVDRQYAKYKIIEDAAASVKRGTIPTPNQWAMAVRKNATEKQRAHGTGMFGPETQAAMDVFETVSPATGARVLTLGGLGGGLYADPLSTLAAAGLVGAGAMTRTGRQMSAGIHPMQQGVLGLLEQAPAGPVSALGAVARASPVVYGQQPEY